MRAVYLKDKNGNKLVSVPYYKVGDLFLTTNSENPSIRFGGTWELFGKGKTLVCVDTSDTDFNEVKKTGGSKYIQEHYHDLLISTNTSTGGSVDRLSPVQINKSTSGRTTFTSGNVNDTVETGNSGNLQPYITCYIWIRVE